MRQSIALIAMAAVLFAASFGWSQPDPHKAGDKGDAKVAAKEGGGDEHHQKKADDILTLKADTAVWTCVVFFLLLFILTKFAWAPILEGLKAREANITNVMEEAKKLRAENQADHAKFQAELKEAYAKIPAMMEVARKDAEELKERIRTEGNAEVQKERQRLLRELDIAKDQALQDLWNQAAQLATLISTKAIGRSLNADDHRRLVDEALDELKKKTGTN